jgi:MerR family glutamine synthetase transcriptional repressor
MAVRVVRVVRRTRATPVYNIGVASRLTGLPVHRLRWIESFGLVEPHRTEGNQRLFSEEDVERLRMVQLLLARRVNLTGIRVILELQGRRRETSRVLATVLRTLGRRRETSTEGDEA